MREVRDRAQKPIINFFSILKNNNVRLMVSLAIHFSHLYFGMLGLASLLRNEPKLILLFIFSHY